MSQNEEVSRALETRAYITSDKHVWDGKATSCGSLRQRHGWNQQRPWTDHDPYRPESVYDNSHRRSRSGFNII